MNLKKLPFRNLARRPARTAALVTLVAFLALSVFAGSLVISSLNNGLKNLESRLGADVIAIPYEAASKINLKETMVQDAVGEYYMPRSNIDKIAGIKGVEAVSYQTYLSSMKTACCSAAIQIIGFDPETDFTVQPWIARRYGKALQACDVVVGASVNLDVGETIRFYDVPCRVVARLDATGTSMDTAAYATEETLTILLAAARERRNTNALGGYEPDEVISAAFIKVRDGFDPQTVAGYVKSRVRGTRAFAARAMISTVADGLGGVQSTILMLIAAIWLIAFVILIVAFSMMINERRREFAVLRVVGTSRTMLSRMILTESAIVGLSGGAIGVALAALVIYPFRGLIERRVGLPFLMPGAGATALLALGTLALCVAIGAVASARTAFRLSRVDAGITLREGN